ncbi:MAG: helix-turn-helix domain-containing protein [Candidatus Fimimonas sp.]
MVEIGRKIKQYRLKLDLTQEELAQRTELTKGYISQLENDLCSPSIATLEDILNVLGVSLQEFFTEPKEEKIVYTNDDYFFSKNGDGTNTWLIPNSQVKEMEPIILTLPQGGECEERLPFEGEEFGYVLCGKVEIVTLHERYKLSAGDSFSIDGKKQHKIVNAQKGESKILWITTPSNF